MIQPPANATFTVHRAETDVLPPVEVSFQLPDVVEEASIQEVTPHPEEHKGEFTVTYEVIKGGSKRGKDRLVDSHCYAYGQRKPRPNLHTLYFGSAPQEGRGCDAMPLSSKMGTISPEDRGKIATHQRRETV